MKKILMAFMFVIIFTISFQAAAADVDEQLLLSDDAQEIEFGGEIYIVQDLKGFQERLRVDDRPVVGLALAGGGARAISNLGVIKALVEHDIPIDLIVGTSMGSIIGNLYSSGLSVEQLEEIMTDTPFSDLFQFGGGRALLETKKLNLFAERVAPNKSLEEFLIPTAQLSFDLKEGRKYLLTRGKISEVLQAAYSIPGYFPIHEFNDRYFMDAGVVESSPAKSAALLGADYVIATHMPTDEEDEDYGGILASSGRFIQILQDKYTSEILSEYADFEISIDVGNYTFMDFNYAARLVELGYQQTLENIDEIKSELAVRNIPLQKTEAREYYDVDQTLRDLEFDRLVTEARGISPLIHYGRDYSFFQPELFRSPLNEFQLGLEAYHNRLNFSLLGPGSSSWTENYEASFRFKKLTDSLDYNLLYGRNEEQADDYESRLKFFGQRFNLSAGFGRRKEEEYYLLGSNFRYMGDDLQWRSENSLFYRKEASGFGVLSSHLINYDLSPAWGIGLKSVYNNTEIARSPLIYKGQELDDYQPKFQAALNLNYNYELLIPYQISNFFQMTDIGGYFFIDYFHEESWGDGSFAIGPALNAKLYLLGLKPLELDLYAAHDFEENDQRYGIQISYSF
ncbi:patatin-like phospholipase family protein [Halanaerobium hydrogeniformans]|uniref:Patatin n=1 Tax=Halanaerobium hydrogeniformans TaxID=656519 RepID=E4RPN9_HALHG|nr:patatin-like phospholipase family protein [Halanaerobium hydrogeniformans]ADQ13923.1 Patatin [Halanaerobium hydrogeniformans]